MNADKIGKEPGKLRAIPEGLIPEWKDESRELQVPKKRMHSPQEHSDQ